MKGVFLDSETVDRGDLDLGALRAALPEWAVYANTAQNRVAEHIKGAEVVVSNKVMLDANVLSEAQRLKLVCVAATGTNNVDLQAARRANITVCNVRGYATASVVQHVFALILALTTRLFPYRRAVDRGNWQVSPQFCLLDYPIREIAGKCLGIVGYGELGRAVARTAEAFDMEVILAQRPSGEAKPGRVPLDALLPQVDILSLHCPLTPETRGLIGERQLALMRADAMLINAARGGIVHEQALADALRGGRPGGAGIDVLSEEPPVHGNPLLDPGIPNLIVTPHIAWASRESRQRLVDQVAENIRAFLAGRPRNVV